MAHPDTGTEKVHTTKQLKDDLKLQTWLARAELRNPSLHREVSALAQIRDELRLQMALGKLEAREEWDHVEKTWFQLRSRIEDFAEDAGEDIKSLMSDIKTAYDRIRSGPAH